MTNNLTMTSATYATSPISGFGQALQPGGYGVAAASLFSAAATSVELEARVLFAAKPTTRNSIIAMQDRLVSMSVTTAGLVQVWFGYVGGSNLALTSTASIADGAAHTITAIYNATAATGQLLVDGVVVASGSTSSVTSFSWTASAFGIGVYPGSSAAYTNQGVIDEVAVFSPARDSGAYTPSTSPYTGSETDLVALYHLDGNGNDSVGAATATAYALTGSATLAVGSAATYTVQPTGAVASATVVTPASTIAGTFSPTSLTFAAGATASQTFTFTPSGSGSGSLSTTNNAGLADPAALSITVSAGATAPGAPTFTLTPGNGSMLVTVEAPSSDGGATITGYPIYAGTSAGVASGASIATLAAAGTYTISGLTNGELEYVNVGATNSVGTTLAVEQSATPVLSGVTIAPNNAAITYSAWNWLVGSTSAKSINPGAYLDFCFSGSSLTLNFDVSANLAPLPTVWLVIDGTATLYTLASSITATMPAATAGWPIHTCRLIFASATCTQNRWTPQSTALTLTSILVATGGSVTAVAASRRKKILIFGDSITEGYQTLAKIVSGTNTDASASDVTQAWGWRFADAVGVDVGIVAFTGQGLTISGNGSVPPIPTTWNYLWSGQARDFTTSPDLIVINQGTNDGGKKATQAAVQTAMTTFLTALVDQFPNTPIVVMQPYEGNGSYMTAAYRTTVTAALQAAIGAVNNGLITWVPTTGWFTAAMVSLSADGTHPLGIATRQTISPAAVAAMGSSVNPPPRSFSSI
ncbi:GDSL-type esterase/lipase family protein [Acetobacter sp. DsW_063]|uniref:GDSL-type esterase/lipase family protein n=1 Tax=Acetobacter sp. DsW_063 TaxID=1514894 RepID=UPI000A387CE8|nr:GDSL-type esterase/lipase family protein [Acetobacter sp. DsW_063]OUJ14201.1 hypothetical protein HK28_00535 [Acetobacter sp. DsW_063]